MGRRPELADPSHERHPSRASCMFSDTLYFLTIIGVWKVLGAIAILVPGFPRLKEWAYAGIFFDVTGAAARKSADARTMMPFNRKRGGTLRRFWRWVKGPIER